MSFTAVTAGSRLKASPQDWGALRDFVHERTGVYYNDACLGLLVSRLEPRLKSPDARGAQDLLLRLTYDTSGSEMVPLFDLAAPHESSFLREPEALEALAMEILPALRERGTARIWSAGCAAGEEPYSIRYQAGSAPELDGMRLEVLGTDLSPRCIAQARRGEYREASLRNIPAERREELLEVMPPTYRVRPRWQEGVRFETRNLIETASGPGDTFDVIFCRNVLIYFSDGARRKVVEMFHETLADDGYLILGHSESLHGLTRAFKPVTFRRGLGYRKD